MMNELFSSPIRYVQFAASSIYRQMHTEFHELAHHIIIINARVLIGHNGLFQNSFTKVIASRHRLRKLDDITDFDYNNDS